jgi:hypothetical protein
MKPNKRMEYARVACPTRKSEALLLAAHSRVRRHMKGLESPASMAGMLVELFPALQSS